MKACCVQLGGGLAVVVSLAMAVVSSMTSRILADDAPATTTYRLQYRFQVGDALRWNVEHLKNVRTVVQGQQQTADMTTRSVKVWRVLEVRDGQAIIENSVERVELIQKISGREELRWDSNAGQQPPPGFEAFAASVGKPLAKITLDSLGKVVSRQDLLPQATPSGQQLTLPLPAEAVPVGHAWTEGDTLNVTLKDGQVKRIETRQRFELVEVKDGLATIRTESQVLTPVNDPEVAVQLIDQRNSGTVTFDIELGRVVAQQLDHDEQVLNFSGDASSMRSVSRFSEKFLDPRVQAAALPKAAN